MCVVQTIYRLEKQFVSWPNEKKQKRECQQNDRCEGFFEAISKMDGTDIVLNLKPSGVFKPGHFYTCKNW